MLVFWIRVCLKMRYSPKHYYLNRGKLLSADGFGGNLFSDKAIYGGFSRSS